MGRFLRKNTFVICYFVVIVFMCFISIKTIKNVYSSGAEAYRGDDAQYKELCKAYNNGDNITKEQLVNNNKGMYILNDDYCEMIDNKESRAVSVYLVYSWFIEKSLFSPVIIPLLLLFPILYLISKEFKSETIKNYLLRANYKKYVLRIFGKAYKYIFLIPIILVIFYISSLYITNFNYCYAIDIGHNFFSTDAPLGDKTFFITYLIVILLNMGIYINIGLTVLSKNKNFFIALVESFIIITVFWLISFAGIGVLVQKITGIWAESINILEIYTWNMITDAKLYLIVNFIYYLITLCIALLAYRNKEKLIIMCER